MDQNEIITGFGIGHDDLLIRGKRLRVSKIISAEIGHGAIADV